ncbi:hypothetical protein [Microbacterium sp. HJ5]
MGEEQGTVPRDRTEGIAPDSGERRGLTPAMRRVLWIVGAVVAAGMALALWLFMTGGSSDAPDATDAATAPSPASTQTQGPLPGATPTMGSEVQTPDATAQPTDRLPPLRTPSPLVSAPLPETGSATGQLVDGFPAEVMGPAPPSNVLQSSIATEGSTMQVTLQARTDATPDEVSQYYRALWGDLGLADAGASGGTDASYSDAHSSLSLAFSASAGTGTVYTVYGVFRTS